MEVAALTSLREPTEPGAKNARALRVLSLETNPSDTEILHANMTEGGIACEMVSVQTGADFVTALEEGSFDLVLAGYPVPSIDGISALELTREAWPNVPFIVVSGTAGEEVAIETLKSGATDYVLKHRLERLVPAVRRAIRKSEERRDRAEKALRSSEQQFRTLVEQIPVATYIQQIVESGKTETRPTVYASPQIEALSGFPPRAFVEDPELWIKLLHPEDRERVLIEDRLTDGSGEPFSVEYRQITRDGRLVWIRDEAVLVRSEEGYPGFWQGVMYDITDRKRAEEALRRSEELYRTVVEQARENVYLVDVESKRVLEANAALGRSLGYSPEELKQMSIYDIVAHDRESIDLNVRRTLAEGRRFVGERRYRRKDGTLADVEVSMSHVPYSDREAICIVAHDITEHKLAEERLRQSLSVLLALRQAGQILSSTLSSKEIVSRLLEIMSSVSNLTAAVISVPDEQGNLRVWSSSGLDSLWERARFAPEAQTARQEALADDEQRLFRLRHPGSGGALLVGLCLPLEIKRHVFGVLEAYGPESLAHNDTVEILSSLSSQAASALENARLYEEVEERERALQELVGKLLGAQEEERRRVAYEVHDGLAQVAVAAHQHLQAFARRYASSVDTGQEDLERILRLVRATVSDARRIIANLRPTTLDDLGLAATISLEVESLREAGYHVTYTENLGDIRLPDPVEIALFRIVQEALNNVRKHAETREVRISLDIRGSELHLEVRDYGRGLDPSLASTESGPGERMGLAGMRERAGILGGNLEINSRPGAGTSIAVTIPLMR